MRISGRLMTVIAALALLGGTATAQLRLRTVVTPPLAAGQSAWLHFYWQNATADALSSFEARATVPTGYTVEYPANRTFSGLNQNNALVPGEVDYHAIRVTVPTSANRSALCSTTVNYVRNGQPVSQRFVFLIPLVRYNGQNLKVVTGEVGPVPANSASWVYIYFQGLAPRLDNFKMTVKDAGGMNFAYPGNRTHSGLYTDPTLSSGEVDYAALYLDTTGLTNGTYKVELVVTYDEKKSESESVVVEVEVGDQAPPTQTDTLSSDRQRITPDELSATFYLNAGLAWAKESYQMVGSLSGTIPGLKLNGQVLPLNLDPYLLFTVGLPNQGPLGRATGKLDKQGRAYSTFKIPSSLVPVLNGMTVYHAFVLLDNKATVLFTSNWVPITFVDE